MRASFSRGLSRSLVVLFLAGCACGTEPGLYDRGVGEFCESSDQCRTNLRCASGTCQPSRSLMAGARCDLTLECSEGLYCGATRRCEMAGTEPEGGDCDTDGQCQSGLVCLVEGFGGRCRAAGMRDIGDTCTGQSACLAGLTCTQGRFGITCQSAPATGVGGDGSALDGGTGTTTPPILGVWSGATCETDDGAATAYFEVPRHTSADHDFFRLPFPSDVRRTATGLDLDGFPTPGTALPVDVMARYVSASETDLDGFATNAVSYFRFSRPYDWESVGDRIRIVDITPGSPGYGQNRGLGWLTTAGRLTKYVCEDWLGVRTGHGDPLRPGTTYAVLLTTGIRDMNGNAFARDEDFVATLGDTAPSDAALMHAWQAHAPLRAFLTDQSIDPTTVLNAAVFTTQTADTMVQRLRAAEQTATLPAITDATTCTGTAVSPCDDGTELRRCGAADPAYTEIHAHLSLPIFQAGTAPYEEPEDGGGIAVDASGQPMVVRTEEVCVAITIPTAAVPAGGYPVLVAAHGTGGSFTDHIRGGIAHEAAVAATPAITIGIDLPQHGSRRGGSTRSPDRLVYNFTNPRAARDVFLQGAADLAGTIRFAREGTILDGAGAPVAIDETRIVLFGHSQGAQHAALLAGDEPSLAGVVLSEAGGDLTQSLLHKTQPFDIARLVPLALLDFDGNGNLAVGDFNPALALFQTFFERVDAVNLARHYAREMPTGAPGLHVFATYGVGDSYTPEPTLQAFATSAGFAFVNPILTAPDFAPTGVDAPLSGNFTTASSAFTFGMRQYAPPAGVDGHFAALQGPEGQADIARFLGALFAGTTPPIGQ